MARKKKKTHQFFPWEQHVTCLYHFPGEESVRCPLPDSQEKLPRSLGGQRMGEGADRGVRAGKQELAQLHHEAW